MANRLVIREYNTNNNTPVYEAITETLKLEHVLPANALARNMCYSATVAVRDRNDQWTSESEPMIFWCFGTPEFMFNIGGQIITESQRSVTIENSSAAIGLFYKQLGQEGLNSYRVDLFDAGGQLLANGTNKYMTEGIRYDTTAPEVTIRGLEDNGQYYIQAFGVTDHGMEVHTPRLLLNVEYAHPLAFSLLEVENIEENATIRIHSNLNMLEGHTSIEPPSYIDGTRIDLTEYGANVSFDEGYTLTGDFTVHLTGQNFLPYNEILTIRNGNNMITLTYMAGWYSEDGVECGYFILRVQNGIGEDYVLYSPFFPKPYVDDVVYIWIQRRGTLYDLQCCVEEGDHVITNSREFDVRMRTAEEWDVLIVDGYMNIEACRLEF